MKAIEPSAIQPHEHLGAVRIGTFGDHTGAKDAVLLFDDVPAEKVALNRELPDPLCNLGQLSAENSKPSLPGNFFGGISLA